MSTDLHTLAGAYVLDALSDDEAEQFRRHLEECTACAVEVRELQQAAATMGASEALPPPTYLKARVLSAVDRTPQLPPRPAGGNVIQVAPNRWRRGLLLMAAAVVIVAGVFGVTSIAGDSPQEPSLLAAGVVRVFQADDAHEATMPTSNGGKISVATSPALGEMAVDTEKLPRLDSGHVYQLWAIHDGQASSVGVLEPAKGAAMDMPSADTEVAITIEPEGGSARPTTDPIMQVNPSDV